jgi:simple sugar transport system permease protein
MALKLERRAAPPRFARLRALAVALTAALLAGTALFLLLGVNPATAYGIMADAAFGSGYALSETLVKAVPLIFTGLSVALAATLLLWNIGAEGQLVFGGIAAAGVGLFWGAAIPDPLLLPAQMIAAGLAGAAWALIPATLKTRYGVSEILTTLLLNYVAIIYMEHLYFGPWRDPAGYGFPGTAMLPEAGRLVRFGATRLNAGLILALLLCLGQRFALYRLSWGYRVRVIGRGPAAARYAGMNVGRQTLAVMALAGMLAGLAGAAEVSGIHFRLQQGLAVGYGYDGIIVAWLAGLDPFLVPVMAVLLGAIQLGGEGLQSTLRMPAAISLILEGVLLFGLLAGEAAVRYRVRWVRPGDNG